ncbi:MAG: ABC transporter ATP-binding protein [Rudaea sp.]
MSNVDLRQITKTFRSVTALSNVSFSVRHGEFFVLLGPTGAGKTTTLRVIAGLEKQDSGSVVFDSEPIDGLTPAERDVAFVFQQYSLYPTMTVYDNLAFPLRSPIRKTPEPEIKKRVQEAADVLRIGHLLSRKTARLSGGEMQRVAIGRAIVREPAIFLMDEPLSNLDAKLREALRVELKHLQKTMGSTILYVTHDQIEALTMADRIAVLNQGKIIQQGTPNDIYDRPATTFVAQLVGTPRINLFEATRENGAVRVKNSELQVPAPQPNLPPSMLLGIRPEDVKPSPEGKFNGQVVLIEPLGVETILHIRSGEQTLLSQVPGMSPVRIGDAVHFNIVQQKLHCFDAKGQRL